MPSHFLFWGHLASLTTPEENAIAHGPFDDDKVFREFPHDDTSAIHHRIKIGPFLGGLRASDTDDSFDGWQWLAGEPWDGTIWSPKKLDDGVTGRDLSRLLDTVSQNGERGTPSGDSKGFIIEYDEMPR